MQRVGAGRQPDGHHVVSAGRGRRHHIQEAVEQLLRHTGIPVRAHRRRRVPARTPAGHADQGQPHRHRHTHRQQLERR